MMRQVINLLRILADPRITKVPVSVLRKLRKQGKNRLPTDVHKEIESGKAAPGA